MRPGIKCQRGENVAAGQMVFESGTIGSGERVGQSSMEVANEISLAELGHAIAQDEIVHPATYVNGIHLDKAVVGEGCADIRHRRIQQQSTAVKPAGIER